MELAEEMKTCISLAQTLTLEAQNMPENRPAQEAMQHLGSLLASNCEKICIGPSFHLYAPEGAVPGSVKPSGMSDNTMKNSTEMIVEEDEEDYETIIYPGRSTTDESNSTYTCQDNAKALCNGIHKFDSVSCTPAQASAHNLESPDFVRKNFNSSSCIPSKSSVPLSGSRSRSGLPAVQLEQTSKKTDVKLPFGFPQIATKEYYKQNHFQEKLPYLQKRVEIIDHIKKDTEETAWEYWPKKYIEESGFCLGVQPGSFYKRGPYFYVTMPHRSSYEILVTNNRQIPCDVDVYVDGKQVSLLRLPAGVSNTIDGPMYSEFAFKLFRSRDAPPHLGIVEGNHENGILKAIFTPQKVEAAEERSVYRLLSSQIPSREWTLTRPEDLWTKDKAVNDETITASLNGSPITSQDKLNSLLLSSSSEDGDDDRETDETMTTCEYSSPITSHDEPNSSLSNSSSDDGDDDCETDENMSTCEYSEFEDHSWCKKIKNEVVEGVTVLQGIKKKQHYLPAPQMETDVSKQVILILRLVASNKEEIEASNEKVSSLEPPPVPSRR